MEKVKIYHLEFFQYAQKSFTYVAEALTPLLRLSTLSWIVARDSHKKFSILNLGCGPPGRGSRPTSGPWPQVENRCTKPFQIFRKFNQHSDSNTLQHFIQ